MTWLFSGILFICASFAALALRARAANDTTRAQINNIPSKSHVIPLLLKLHAYGIRDPLLSWVRSFLTNRQQRVVLRGHYSSWTAVVSGVPQGTVLGGLVLFRHVFLHQGRFPSENGSMAMIYIRHLEITSELYYNSVLRKYEHNTKKLRLLGGMKINFHLPQVQSEQKAIIPTKVAAFIFLTNQIYCISFSHMESMCVIMRREHNELGWASPP